MFGYSEYKDVRERITDEIEKAANIRALLDGVQVMVTADGYWDEYGKVVARADEEDKFVVELEVPLPLSLSCLGPASADVLCPRADPLPLPHASARAPGRAAGPTGALVPARVSARAPAPVMPLPRTTMNPTPRRMTRRKRRSRCPTMTSKSKAKCVPGAGKTTPEPR